MKATPPSTAIPTIETVRKWAKETEDGFRFALKFPRVITHECRLVSCNPELAKFIECLEILDDAERSGPTFIQLPPDFDRREFHVLEKFLSELPDNLPFAVEFRHKDYFEGEFARKANQLLRSKKMDRVVFDSRPLFHFSPADLTESEARQRKPQPPVRPEALGQFPLVRFIGVNRVEKLEPWISFWAQKVATWIGEGRTPFLFTHTPNDEFAPEFARMFHQALQKLLPDLPSLRELDSNTETQLDLF